jgi:hypothetical protein
MKNFVLMLIFLNFIQDFAFAGKVPSCEGQQEIFSPSNLGVVVKNIESMPKMIYVAKRAKYLIESKKHSFQLAATQSFLQGESKILCSTLSRVADKGFSIYAPTLIDLTDEKKTGNSFWQFHVSIGQSQLGIWNQKTRMFDKNKEVEKSLTAAGLQLQILQISHDEFDLIFSRENGEFSEQLVIRFDAFQNPR